MSHLIDLSTGVRLNYVERGPRDGIPAIFLHGVTDSWRAFERLLPRLPEGVRAFALSQRGHGDSSRPAAGYRFTDFAGDLLAFMDALSLSRAVIVGHSMGASVAQRFAIDHPDRIAALVLMGAFASFQNDEGLRDFVHTSVLPLTDPIDAGFAREWQLSTLARPMDPDHLDTVVNETRKVPAFVWHAAFQGFLDTEDFTDQLRGVTAPTRLLWGDRDTYVSRHAQDRLLAAIPGARLRVYEGGGHAFHWEDPAAVVDEIRAVVSQAEG